MKKILISFTLVFISSHLSFAHSKGRRFNAEALKALEACGLTKPEKGQRPDKETRQKIRDCLKNAGIKRPRRRRSKEGRQHN